MSKYETNNYLKQTKLNYNRIAVEFSSKREHLTEDILYFKKYVKKTDSVLDLGCGNGRLTEMLKSSNKYFGIDNSKELIKIAKKRYPNFNFQQGDILTTNLKNKFNIIFSLSVIHHIPKQYNKRFVEVILNHLSKNGVAIITSWKYKKDLVKNSKKISKNEFLYPFKNSRGEVLAERYFYKFSQKELENIFPASKFKILESGAKWRGKNENYFVAAKKK